MPNLTWFRKRIHSDHCDETPLPTTNAKNAEIRMRTRPEYGATYDR